MKVADYSDQVTVDELDAALRAGGFEAVLHYLAGTPGWARRIEDPAVVAGIRAKGWPQMGIDIPFSPADVSGTATAARVAQVYGFGAGLRIWLDIEPERWVLDRARWVAAADRWCDEVRAAGFSPGPYGDDETVAACASRADAIWRAKPGECDPAGPGLAEAFFAGRRMIQCGAGTWGGVQFDVNYSQFGGGEEMVLDLSFWTGQAQIAVMAMHNKSYAEVDPGGKAVASLASTWMDRYVNGNTSQPGQNDVLDAWTGVTGNSPVVTPEEINVADVVAQLQQRPAAAGVDPAKLTALLKQVAADFQAASQDPAL